MVLPDCMMPDGAEPCKGYQLLRATLDADRDGSKKIVAERDKWFDAAMRLKTALGEARAALASLDSPSGRDSGLSLIRGGKPIQNIIDDALMSA